MNWEELIKKYNLDVGSMTNKRKIKVLEAKGIYVKQLTQGNRWHPAEFEVIDDSIFNDDWHKHPTLPRELTKDGKVRDSETKNLCSIISTSDGYYECLVGKQHYRHHRLLMETFNPIDNSNEMYVDHINGKKQDNRLENLRWSTPLQNSNYKNINRKGINDFLNLLIQKYGYEETLKLCKKELTKYLECDNI